MHSSTPIQTIEGVDGKTYFVFNGTWYSPETSMTVIEIIDEALMRSGDKYRPRFKFHYGYPKTGKVWGDIETGYVGRSGGEIKIPLIVKSRRSLGGGSLLESCIVKIEHANKRNGGIIYDITKKN